MGPAPSLRSSCTCSSSPFHTHQPSLPFLIRSAAFQHMSERCSAFHANPSRHTPSPSSSTYYPPSRRHMLPPSLSFSLRFCLLLFLLLYNLSGCLAVVQTVTYGHTALSALQCSCSQQLSSASSDCNSAVLQASGAAFQDRVWVLRVTGSLQVTFTQAALAPSERLLIYSGFNASSYQALGPATFQQPHTRVLLSLQGSDPALPVPFTLISQTDTITVRLISGAPSLFPGFSLSFCGRLFQPPPMRCHSNETFDLDSLPSGPVTIKSHGTAGTTMYDDGMPCDWVIRSNTGRVTNLLLTWSYFATYPGDIVSVYSDIARSQPLVHFHGRWSTSTLTSTSTTSTTSSSSSASVPPPIISNTGILAVSFTSSNTHRHGNGFIATVSSTNSSTSSCLFNLNSNLNSSSGSSAPAQQCSGHGRCVGGKCACDEGFWGADCSADQCAGVVELEATQGEIR